jgi:prepilin-type N-terminal cleavage/methylation domain-containing protein
MYQRLLTARKAHRNEDGFTLIELLIVIVILGVLAGIVVFSVRGISDRGATAACKANSNSVSTAVEAYYAKNSTYPTADGDLTGAGGFLKAPVPTGFITYNGAGTAPTVKDTSTC